MGVFEAHTKQINTILRLEVYEACVHRPGINVSPRPISRERERRTSTRLHRGIPTSSDLQREATRMSIGQPGLPQGSIMSGLGPGPAIMASTPGGGRRGSASKEDVPRSGSSKHVRNK
ncbi:hypothetical protein RRG08_027344 [Elysia crispata]|uniref:Uncharacterized protein n=1 Tax=Elysia crispata TaxID=231223 RepID=A0AAE0ZPE7_9GAST|nr:hypothetical protein RRG08_027344 [Elysia crispata]